MTKKVFTKLSVLSYKTIDCFQFHYFTHNANFYLQLNDLKNKTKNPCPCWAAVTVINYQSVDPMCELQQ